MKYLKYLLALILVIGAGYGMYVGKLASFSETDAPKKPEWKRKRCHDAVYIEHRTVGAMKFIKGRADGYVGSTTTCTKMA